MVSAPVGMPPGQYVLKMGYVDAQTGRSIGEFMLPANTDDISVELPMVFPSLEAVRAPTSLNLIIRDELNLVGYELDTNQTQAGESVWLTLYWQALVDVRHDYVVALRLLDATGAEVAYWLGRPVYSSYPTNGWKAHQVVQDPWRLVLPAQTVPGAYRLEVALFDAVTQSEVTSARLDTLTVLLPEDK